MTITTPQQQVLFYMGPYISTTVVITNRVTVIYEHPERNSFLAIRDYVIFGEI